MWDKCLVVLFLSFMTISCSSNSSEIDESTLSSSSLDSSNSLGDAIIHEWVSYLQSSDQGLWEESANSILFYRNDGPFIDEELPEPAIYRPYAVCSFEDTVYVTDTAKYQIVALDGNGSVLWKAGGEGEGPGHFTMMTSLAVSKNYIAALNYAQSRIEFFNKDGSFSHSTGFVGAEDIVAISDSLFAVASSMEHGGDIHILDPNDGVLSSFGEVETIHYANIPRSDLLRLCSGPNGILCLYNRYEGLLAIYDIYTKECLFRGSRNYPASPEPPREERNSSGETRMAFFPIGGNTFVGPDGMLNVVICNLMEDGSFISDPEYLDFAPITAIDRYDWEGNYLDSYCLPDSCINYVTCLPDGRIIGRNFAEGTLREFSQRPYSEVN